MASSHKGAHLAEIAYRSQPRRLARSTRAVQCYASAMRRFPLRLKIAAFAAGLVALAVGLVAFFTVIQPWRAKLVEQEKFARHLVQTALPLGVEVRPDGTAHFDPVRMHALVANASDIVYALLWDGNGQFDAAASSVNLAALHRVAAPLAHLYLKQRT